MVFLKWLPGSEKVKRAAEYFSGGELALWGGSAALIAASFFVFDRENVLTLLASLIGVTSLIFNARGNPAGQFLMVVFSGLYGVISYSFSYYGEMITYLGMTGPMAVVALVTWLRNPYGGNRAQVRVNRLGKGEAVFMLFLTGAVTFVFYHILAAFHTANLLPSTLSVATSFLGVYMTFRRSAFFALGYAANDVVLIVLWVLVACADISYISVVICFGVFLVNDIYGFVSWSKMQRRQEEDNIHQEK